MVTPNAKLLVTGVIGKLKRKNFDGIPMAAPNRYN